VEKGRGYGHVTPNFRGSSKRLVQNTAEIAQLVIKSIQHKAQNLAE